MPNDFDPDYEAWLAQLEATCDRSYTTRGSDPHVIGCDLPEGHDGPHTLTDPLGPDTGTWAWTLPGRMEMMK